MHPSTHISCVAYLLSVAGVLFTACSGGDPGQANEPAHAGAAGSDPGTDPGTAVSNGNAGEGGAGGMGSSGGSSGASGTSGNAGAGGTAGIGGASGNGGSAGAGGNPPPVYTCPASDAPSGMPTGCGDGHIDAMSEECDDANPTSDTDFCTNLCQLRDRPLVWDGMTPGSKSRRLGQGPHVMAAGCHGFAIATVDYLSDLATIELRRFDHRGQPVGTAIELAKGPGVVDFSHPSVAALPDGSYAITWTEYGGDGDGLGIKLQKVAADGTTWPGPRTVNTTTKFGQYDADVAWSNEQLIVAWTDDSNVQTAPDIRYRVYSTVDLFGSGGEQTLADTKAGETRPTISAVGNGYAFAYLHQELPGSQIIVQDDQGNEVRTGDWMGQSAPIARSGPRLVEGEGGKLAVAFASSASWNVDSPLGISVFGVDLSQPMGPEFALDWSAPPDSDAGELESFSLAIANRELFVASGWYASLSATTGSNVYLQSQPLDNAGLPMGMSTLLPLPREGTRPGDQENAVLASFPLAPTGALVAAWEDAGLLPNTQKPVVQPMVSLIPTPVRRLLLDQ